MDKYGEGNKGLFAIADIKKGEIIDRWEGEIYEVQEPADVPNDPPLYVKDHALQFAENKYRDTEGVGRYINHSCDPNCGFRDTFTLVTMLDIKRGEELTFDYETTEDGDLRMECKCGSKNCRKVIGAYRNMPREVRKRHKEYISPYLIKKYGEP